MLNCSGNNWPNVFYNIKVWTIGWKVWETIGGDFVQEISCFDRSMFWVIVLKEKFGYASCSQFRPKHARSTQGVHQAQREENSLLTIFTNFKAFHSSSAGFISTWPSFYNLILSNRQKCKNGKFSKVESKSLCTSREVPPWKCAKLLAGVLQEYIPSRMLAALRSREIREKNEKLGFTHFWKVGFFLIFFVCFM